MKKIIPIIYFLCCSFTYCVAQNNISESITEVESVAVDSTFTIADLELPVYDGVSKNDLPYSGYFKMGSSDFFWIDFYALGEKTAQYSYDLLEDIKRQEKTGDSTGQKKIMDIASTFRNNRIVDGNTHQILKNAILTKTYGSGALLRADIDIFGENYYNRITVRKSNRFVYVSNYRDSVSQIRIIPQHGILNMALLVKGEIIAANNKNDCKFERPKRSSLIRAFWKDENNNCFSISNETDLEPYSLNLNLIEKMIQTNPIDDTGAINFDAIVDVIIRDFDPNAKSLKISEMPLISAYVNTRNNGKIEDGIYWSPFEEGSGVYRIYESGLMTIKGSVSIYDFQKVFESYMKTR